MQNPTITPSGRKVMQAERREKREKMPLIVDTLFRDSIRKPLGPIYISYYGRFVYTFYIFGSPSATHHYHIIMEFLRFSQTLIPHVVNFNHLGENRE